MFPNLEFIKTMMNGLRSRIEKVENGLLKRIEKVEDWAVSEDQVTQTVADYFVKNPIVESDPTVPAWAKEPTKPTYTAKEIGAQPDMYVVSFDSVLGELAGKTVVYVAYPGSASPIPSGRYPVLLMRSGIDRGQASIVAYDAAGKTWAGGANFVQGTIELVERTLTASDIGAIPAPATAEIGQAIAVKAVDETGKPTEWEVVEIPTALPNPNALTFTGAVTGSYDGSAPLSVEIPSGGGSSGGSGKAKSQILIDQEITELTASLSVTLEHDFHNLTAIINCGSAGAALTADAEGKAVASKIGLLIDTTDFGNNSRKVAQINTSTGTWKTMMCGAEWSDDLSVFKLGFTVEIAVGANSQYNFLFGGPTAMYGTVAPGDVDNAPRTGKTANIVVNGAYLNVGTKVVLWGEYYE